MRSFTRKMYLPVLFGLGLFCFGTAAYAQDERPRVNPYSGFDGDSSGLLDAINRDHGRPAARPHVVRQYPDGSIEYNPYEYRKYRYDSPGLIDAINHDFPRTWYPSSTGSK